MYPDQVPAGEYDDFRGKLSPLLASSHRSLIPVAYKTKGSTLFVPSSLTLTIEYWEQESAKTIVSARLEAVFVEGDPPDNITALTIKVMPLSLVSCFLDFHMPTYVYAVLFVYLIGAGCFVLCKLAFNRGDLLYFFRKSLQCFLVPAAKGFGLVLMTCGSFLGFFILLGKTTNFDIIPSNYDNKPVDKSAATLIDNGRQGIPLVLAGIGLFMSILDRSFKIPTEVEARILLEGEKKHCKLYKSEKSEKNWSESRVPFFIMILNAKKYYLFVWPLVYMQLYIYLYNQLLTADLWVSVPIAILLLPLLIQLPIMLLVNRLKDILFLGVFYIIGEVILSMCLLRVSNVLVSMVLRCVSSVYWLVFRLGFDICQRRLYAWLHRQHRGTWAYGLLEDSIKLVVAQRTQEKSMKAAFDISVSICSVFMRPLGLGLVYLLQGEAQLTESVLNVAVQTDTNILYALIQTPLELLLVGLVFLFVDNHLRLQVLDLVEYYQHLFKHRGSRWVCDAFGYRENLQASFRPLDKLCFSSQYYFFVFGMAMSLLAFLFGVFMVMRNSYVFCNDPAFLMLLFCILFSRKLGELLVSFISVKSKLYYQKPAKDHGKLDSVSAFEKRRCHDEYFDLEAVKHYFISSRSGWIVANLHRILSKRNFHEDGRRILTKYILELNAQKRRRLESRRRQVEQELLQNEGRVGAHGPRVLTVSLKLMQNTVQPVLSQWLALAKQYALLKRFVQDAKERKSNCEFCKIDMELEVLEKYPFWEVVNRFRVENVGKPFSAHAFAEFYRQNQQLITICFECKLKKEHIHRSERLEMIKSKNNLCARLIVRKWLMCARSILLHQRPT